MASISLHEVSEVNWRVTLQLAVHPDQQRFIGLVTQQHPHCQQLKLTVHPENSRARSLYTSVGFRPRGTQQDDEPVYMLRVRD
jgi:hypothetical protein